MISQKDQILSSTFPFLVTLVAGFIFILLYSLQFYDRPEGVGLSVCLSVFGVVIMASGAFLLSGVFLGFLFGIPRTVGDNQFGEGNNNGDSSNLDDYKSNYLPNTNLEQISDWFTKILVGVGLTQISEIVSAIDKLVAKLAPGFGDSTNETINTSFVIVVLIYFSFCGFFLGFLWARLYLPGRFKAADFEQLGEQLGQVGGQVGQVGEQLGQVGEQLGQVGQEVKRVREKAEADLEQLGQQFKKATEQAEFDANAQILVNRQLNRKFPEVSPEKLNKAIKATSDAKKFSIFVEVQGIRSENWSNPATKPKMERTIPIFRALIDSTVEQPYHRYYGELGFALKDKRNPEWKEAETVLSRAIELRGDWKEHGDWTTYYEFNLVMCKIAQDTAFNNGQPSSQITRSVILQNLSKTVESGILTKEKIENSPTIEKWLSLNHISIEDLLLSKTNTLPS